MDYRQLGRCGLRVSTLTLGTMTIGGRGAFASVGDVDLDGARRHIDLALDAGVNLIDTADVYSDGVSEEIIGQALVGRRDRVLLATKARMPMGEGPNDAGLSRHHLIEACEASLRRLRTDHIDLYQVHEWDGQTPLEETLDTLDTLVRAGKVRYVGCSNYAAWQLVKALGISDRLHLQRFVSQQIYYSLQAREAEYELVPAALDQGVGILVWSPLAGGLLSGKYRRDAAARAGPPPHRLGRAAGARPGAGSTTSSTSWSRSPRPTGSRPPRSRSPTPSASPGSRHWSSARARTSSWPTTSPPPTSCSAPRSARGWTRSARCPCSIPTGTRPRPRPTA